MPKKMSKNEKNSNRRADRRADYVKWRCTEIAEVWGGVKRPSKEIVEIVGNVQTEKSGEWKPSINIIGMALFFLLNFDI